MKGAVGCRGVPWGAVGSWSLMREVDAIDEGFAGARRMAK